MIKTSAMLVLFTFTSVNAFAATCEAIWESATIAGNTTTDIYEKLTKKSEKNYKSTLRKNVNKTTFIDICKKNQAKGYTD